MRADPALAAAEVGDKAAAGHAYVLGERGEHRPVKREPVKLSPDELRVADRDGIVGSGRHGELLRRSRHASRS